MLRRLTDRFLRSFEGRFAPASEVERLDLAFGKLAELAEDLAKRAPSSEVERLDLAFGKLAELAEDLAKRAPSSEVERLDLAFEELSRLRAELPHEVIFRVQSERNVEIPWVLSSYRGERRVLEIGFAHAEARYVEALASLEIPVLVGVDLIKGPAQWPSSFLGVIADVRTPVFRPGSFDLILCISTIEHVGRDNTGYGIPARLEPDHPDHEAIARLASWLAPAGRLLLSVPYGRYEDHGWLINYDPHHLEALIEASGLAVGNEQYYELRGGWVPCNKEEVRRRGYESLGAPHAGAVALIEMVKS